MALVTRPRVARIKLFAVFSIGAVASLSCRMAGVVCSAHAISGLTRSPSLQRLPVQPHGVALAGKTKSGWTWSAVLWPSRMRKTATQGFGPKGFACQSDNAGGSTSQSNEGTPFYSKQGLLTDDEVLESWYACKWNEKAELEELLQNSEFKENVEFFLQELQDEVGGFPAATYKALSGQDKLAVKAAFYKEIETNAFGMSNQAGGMGEYDLQSDFAELGQNANAGAPVASLYYAEKTLMEIYNSRWL